MAELDPKERVTLALVLRTNLGHVKSLREFLQTYPNTQLVYRKTRIGHLYIHGEKTIHEFLNRFPKSKFLYKTSADGNVLYVYPDRVAEPIIDLEEPEEKKEDG